MSSKGEKNTKSTTAMRPHTLAWISSRGYVSSNSAVLSLLEGFMCNHHLEHGTALEGVATAIG